MGGINTTLPSQSSLGITVLHFPTDGNNTCCAFGGRAKERNGTGYEGVQSINSPNGIDNYNHVLRREHQSIGQSPSFE